MKDAFEWNRENLQNLLNNYSLLLKSPLRANLPYCVYLISFTGFVSYLSQWMTYKIECDDRKPHPFLFKGKFVKDSITCNPEEQCFETIDPKIHTLTDIRKSVHLASVTSSRFARYGNKEAIHTRKQWLSYNDVRFSPFAFRSGSPSLRSDSRHRNEVLSHGRASVHHRRLQLDQVLQ